MKEVKGYETLTTNFLEDSNRLVKTRNASLLITLISALGAQLCGVYSIALASSNLEAVRF